MTAKPLCDRTVALASEASPQRHARLVLATTILASSLDFIDGSVVNVGLPAIRHSLHGDAAELQWVINAYLLPLSALLLLGGALGDRFGRRRVLIAGVSLFALGSAACALAGRLEGLIAARALQGVAAAMMLPNSLAILGGAFEGPERGRAVGLWASAGSIAGAIGPVLGGWLIDTSGWRAIFLINLPLAAAAVGLALFALDRGRPAAPAPRLDLTGAALITAALAGLVWGLTEGAGAAGWSPAAIGALAAGLILAVAFVWTEKRKGDQAMTPLALFGSRPLVALNLLTLLLYGGLSSFLLLIPYVLISGLGYSATAAGAALLPFPLLAGLLSAAIGGLAGRIGARRPLIVGAGLVAAGFLLALRISPGSAYWTTALPSITLVALGMACSAGPLTNAVLTAVDARHRGAGSGLNSAVAQLGGVVAIALIGGVLATRGTALVEAFHVAVVAAALAALGAAACIALWFDGRGAAA